MSFKNEESCSLTRTSSSNGRVLDNRILDRHFIPSEIMERVSLLYRAVEAHDESSVKSILTLYDDLDTNCLLPGWSMPLLHFAVGLSNNSPEIVLLLLEKGGDPNNLTTEDNVSPMHLSVIYDYEHVLHVLMRNGGNATLVNGDGKSCYDLAKDNVEEEMKERCFLYFYKKSVDFRKSIKPSDSVVKAWKDTHPDSSIISFSNNSSSADEFITCESSDSEPSSIHLKPVDATESINISAEQKKLWNKFSYLMTEDESEQDSSRDDNGKLSTIEEESALSISYQRKLGYEETKECTIGLFDESNYPMSPPTFATTPNPAFSDSSSVSSTATEIADSTPPILPPPSKTDMIKLQTTMKDSQIPPSSVPVTKSTYQVLNRLANQSQLTKVLAPKPGTCNFSSELKQAITDLHVIDEWGNLKIDLLQSYSTPSKKSKSFYNYLLLDPKITKKANFSGTHLKSDIIKNPEKFEAFLKSIFYIGKGCGKRPIQHLVDAKEKYGSGRKVLTGFGEKLDRILNIWSSGLGVIVVSVFHHSSEREANVNEASMIDAVGLVELSNIKKGSYAGTLTSTWSQKSKNQLGTFLLYKAFCAFTVSEHKSFHAQDV